MHAATACTARHPAGRRGPWYVETGRCAAPL